MTTITESLDQLDACASATGKGLYGFYRAVRRDFLKSCAAHREITRHFKPGAEALKWTQADMAKFRASWASVRAEAACGL